MNVAKTHPEVIKTLILADPVGFESMLPNTPESQRLAQMTQDRIDTLRKILQAEILNLLRRSLLTRSMRRVPGQCGPRHNESGCLTI